MDFTLGRQHRVCLRETWLFEQDRRPIDLMLRSPAIYVQHDTETLCGAQH